MSTIRKIVGAKIRLLRKSRLLTQADLAEKIDGDIVQLGRYERGINTPGIEQLLKLAFALEVPPSDLLPTDNSKLLIEHLHSLRETLSEKVLNIQTVEDIETLIQTADAILAKKTNRS